MPYKTLDELPSSIKDHLPPHAQEIYFSAFNEAWQEYQEPEKRRTNDTLEEVCHKVAWSAVKKKYKKEGEEWHPL